MLSPFSVVCHQDPHDGGNVPASKHPLQQPLHPRHPRVCLLGQEEVLRGNTQQVTQTKQEVGTGHNHQGYVGERWHLDDNECLIKAELFTFGYVMFVMISCLQ